MLMKIRFYLYSFILLFFFLGGADNAKAQSFPSITCDRVGLPAQTIPLKNSKLTLVCVVFSNKASEDLETWLNPVYTKFIAKTGMMDDMYDVNLHFVAAFSGATKAFKGEFIKKVEKNGDKDLVPYILMADKEDFVAAPALKVAAKAVPYFYVIDATGTIVYSTSGPYSQAKMDQIESIVIDNLN